MRKVSRGDSGYQRPQLSVFNVEAEAGFTISDGYGMPGENPDFNDFGDF